MKTITVVTRALLLAATFLTLPAEATPLCKDICVPDANGQQPLCSTACIVQVPKCATQSWRSRARGRPGHEGDGWIDDYEVTSWIQDFNFDYFGNARQNWEFDDSSKCDEPDADTTLVTYNYTCGNLANACLTPTQAGQVPADKVDVAHAQCAAIASQEQDHQVQVDHSEQKWFGGGFWSKKVQKLDLNGLEFGYQAGISFFKPDGNGNKNRDTGAYCEMLLKANWGDRTVAFPQRCYIFNDLVYQASPYDRMKYDGPPAEPKYLGNGRWGGGYPVFQFATFVGPVLVFVNVQIGVGAGLTIGGEALKTPPVNFHGYDAYIGLGGNITLTGNAEASYFGLVAVGLDAVVELINAFIGPKFYAFIPVNDFRVKAVRWYHDTVAQIKTLSGKIDIYLRVLFWKWTKTLYKWDSGLNASYTLQADGKCEVLDCGSACNGVVCGQVNLCGATCTAGSGCCRGSCTNKQCGADDGCGGTCTPGSGCTSCTPVCSGVACGQPNGCGGTCQPGSGCTVCTPRCSGVACYTADGCGGTCEVGSGCTAAPIISVNQHWDGAVVNNNTTVTFPNSPVVNAPTSAQYEIRNLGSAVLKITNPSTLISGSGYSIITAPSLSIGPKGTTLFRVRLMSNTAGTKTGSINIQTNDTAHSPYAFNLAGTVTGSTGCTPWCGGKACGSDNGCGTACAAGSGCTTTCTPVCSGKFCGADNGCGTACVTGSGCATACTSSCTNKSCGADDGCGNACASGSGCVAACVPSCSGKWCGDNDGCGNVCFSGCYCSPNCGGGRTCGASNGCGGVCSAGSGCNSLPIGYLDLIDANGVAQGWACDADSPTTSIQVQFANATGTVFGIAVASSASEAAVNSRCGGGTAHRFTYQLPPSAANQLIYATAIDPAWPAVTPWLTGTPMLWQPAYQKAYLGCWGDSGPRDLPYWAISNGSVSIASCVDTCSHAGYEFAGAQYSSYCLCGHTYGTYGQSGQCNMGCSAGAGQTCGGGWSNSVYSTDVASKGCFVDKPTRDLPYLAINNSPSLTVAQCTSTCRTAGYAYAGVEAGSNCFCGNTYGRYAGSSGCVAHCTGDDTSTCGGNWAIQVTATGKPGPATPQAPIGRTDYPAIDANGLLTGYACDWDAPQAAVTVQIIWWDGSQEQYIDSVVAGDPAEPAVVQSCLQGADPGPNHRFHYQMPSWLWAQQVRFYAVDPLSGTRTYLGSQQRW